MKKHIVMYLWIIATVFLILSIIAEGLGIVFSEPQNSVLGIIFISLIGIAMLVQTLQNKHKNTDKFWFLWKLCVVVGFYIETMIACWNFYN